MSRKSKVLVMSICGVAVFAAFATAQEKAKIPVSISLEGRADYSDNRDSSADKHANTDLSVVPQAKVTLSSANKSSLDLYYAPSFRYRENPSVYQNDKEIQQNLSIKGQVKVTPNVGVRASDQFNYTDDPAIQDDRAGGRRDSSFKLNRVDIGCGAGVSRTTSMDVRLTDRIKRYDDSERAKDSDEDSYGIAGILSKTLTRTLSVSASADVSQYDYESSKGLDRGFLATMAGVGAEKTFSESLQGTFRCGYIGADFDKGSQSAPFADLAVKVASSPASSVTLGSRYMLRESFVYPFSAQTFTDVRAKWDWNCTSKLGFSLSGTYELGKYESKAMPENASLDEYQAGTENTVILGAQVVYWVAKDMYVRVGQTFENRDSDAGQSESYTRNASSIAFGNVFF